MLAKKWSGLSCHRDETATETEIGEEEGARDCASPRKRQTQDWAATGGWGLGRHGKSNLKA